MAACPEMTEMLTDVGETPAGHSPVEAFVKGMTGQVNANDVTRMMALQQHMLSRFEKTNEMLLNFNHLSENRFVTTQLEFKKHITLLTDTKKDLDNVFRRIRILKDKLRVRYPEAFAVCAQVYRVPDDDSQDGDKTHQDTLLQTGAVSKIVITDGDPFNATGPSVANSNPAPFVPASPSIIVNGTEIAPPDLVRDPSD